MKRPWTRHLPVEPAGENEDPARDSVLASHLAEYESAADELDAAFRAQLRLVTAEALRTRRNGGWIVATSRFSRATLAVSMTAAAAAVIFVSRLPSPTQDAERDVLLTATVGAASPQDLARSWSSDSSVDRDLLAAFGIVTP
ncbi:MAG: hypothetical protein WC700_12635 [Gemmatimonadaceae bacterium]|jgi:hypothetical protein